MVSGNERENAASGKYLHVLVDASDVLYLKPAEYIASPYEKTIVVYPRRDKDVVLLAAERYCWRQMDGESERLSGGRDFCSNFDTFDTELSSLKYPNGDGV